MVSDGAPCREGLLRFQEAKGLRAGPPELATSERRHNKRSGQCLERSRPLDPKCKVTVSYMSK